MQTIEQFWTPDALPNLITDLRRPGNLWILAYYIEIPFLDELIPPSDRDSRIHLLTDRSQPHTLALIKHSRPQLQTRIWSKAWVMHTKLIMIPDLPVAYIGSPNLTSYSYHRALNITLRITHTNFLDTLLADITKRWSQSKPFE